MHRLKGNAARAFLPNHGREELRDNAAAGKRHQKRQTRRPGRGQRVQPLACHRFGQRLRIGQSPDENRGFSRRVVGWFHIFPAGSVSAVGSGQRWPGSSNRSTATGPHVPAA